MRQKKNKNKTQNAIFHRMEEEFKSREANLREKMLFAKRKWILCHQNRAYRYGFDRILYLQNRTYYYGFNLNLALKGFYRLLSNIPGSFPQFEVRVLTTIS